jgi:hypothetical protein
VPGEEPVGRGSGMFTANLIKYGLIFFAVLLLMGACDFAFLFMR